MADERVMETMIKRTRQGEVEELLEILKSLDQNEQKEIMVFIQGVKFAKVHNPVQTAQTE